MTTDGRRRRLIWAIDALVVLGLGGAAAAGATVLSGGELPIAAAATTTTISPSPTVPGTGGRPQLVTAPATKPTTMPAPVFRAPLTGVRVDEATSQMLAGRRSIAVKIDDAPAVDTHPGLDQADIVYEVSVEGGLTRYLALFQSQVPERVGPVRSVRTTDFSLVANLGVPVLAFSGGNSRTVADALRLPVIAFPPDLADRGVYWRDKTVDAPHNLFLSPLQVWGHVLGGAGAVAPFANVRTDSPSTSTAVAAVPAAGVRLQFSNVTDSSFVWDEAKSAWVRFQRGRAQLDGSGRPLGVDNVVVLFTQYGVSPYDRNSPEAVSIGGGQGLLLSGGASQPVVWTRPDGASPFTLSTPEGGVIDLPVGRTWTALVGGGPERATPIDPASAAIMLASR